MVHVSSVKCRFDVKPIMSSGIYREGTAKKLATRIQLHFPCVYIFVYIYRDPCIPISQPPRSRKSQPQKLSFAFSFFFVYFFLFVYQVRMGNTRRVHIYNTIGIPMYQIFIRPANPELILPYSTKFSFFFLFPPQSSCFLSSTLL